MYTQINVPTQSDKILLPQQGFPKSFPKNKSKQELLKHSCILLRFGKLSKVIGHRNRF
jgi:hypothetical protein